MKIFIVRIQEFLKYIDKCSFERVYKSDKRNIEFQLGRFITKYIASSVYGLDNTEIDVDNKKPYFTNSGLNFSISHSNDILAVAFSEGVIGLDIEKFKPRNLCRLSDYFKKKFNTLDEFYQYWTLYEANYKSKLSCEPQKTFRFEDYFISISLEKNTKVEMYEVTHLKDIIDLKLVDFRNIGDMKLVFDEINISDLELLPQLSI